VTTIVSDTSPINYLCLIGAIDILPRLFDQVLIPTAVFSELKHARAPEPVSRWLANMPSWAKVQQPLRLQVDLGLDPGETEAISLALEMGISVILMDERRGRMAAKKCGITAIGILNVLDTADRRGFLNFEEATNRLRSTNFHVDPKLIEILVQRVRSRKQP
jgi:predicted nucleic acid-binding protein